MNTPESNDDNTFISQIEPIVRKQNTLARELNQSHSQPKLEVNQVFFMLDVLLD